MIHKNALVKCPYCDFFNEPEHIDDFEDDETILCQDCIQEFICCKDNSESVLVFVGITNNTSNGEI